MTDRDPVYRRHRFPAEVIAHAVWLYFRFPLSLRMVENLLAARGIIVSHQTIRLWAEKFGRTFADEIRRRSSGRLGDKSHLDEAVVSIGGKKHWLRRAADQDGFVLDVLVQKPPQRQGGQAPDAQAVERSGPSAAGADHLQASILRCSKARGHAGCRAPLPQGLNNRAENSHQPVRRRERIMKRKSRRHLQRFVSIHDPIANLFHIPRHDISSSDHHELRAAAINMWAQIARA